MFMSTSMACICVQCVTRKVLFKIGVIILLWVEMSALKSDIQLESLLLSNMQITAKAENLSAAQTCWYREGG